MKKINLKEILFDKSNNYIKRIVTLIALVHLILGSIIYTILFPLIIFNATKGSIEMVKILNDSFMKILDYDFLLVCVGIGVLTTKDFAVAMIEKAKAKAGGYGDITTGDDTTVIQNKNKTTEPPIEQIPQ